jgi:beta-phosphoglucomutase-like phosphatase (HAD superfamily)
MIFPERKFEAYLYDCDGTLADTMEPHAQTWVEELARYGCKIEKSLIYELAGMPGRKTVMEINRRYGLSLPPDEISEKKEELFYDKFLAQVKPIAPVVAHLREVAKFAKIAVVSGGKRKVVEETLVLIGVRDLVSVLRSHFYWRRKN